MNKSAPNNAVFDTMHREHEALREKLSQIHNVFTGEDPSAKEIKCLLNEFEEALVVHFSHEEEEGFFDEVTAQSPPLAGEASDLNFEHEVLHREATELCRFAVSGSPSMPWWRELANRCHVFSQKLMHHESAENRLLQNACRRGLDVAD